MKTKVPFQNWILFFYPKTTLQATLLLSQIKRLSSLEILDLQFQSKLLRDFKAFTHNLPYLKKFKTLNITFCYLDFSGSPLFCQFLRSLNVLRKLTQLHSLKLYFHHPSQITNQSIYSLASLLPELHSLKKVHIQFVGIGSLKSSTILQFFSSFGSLKNLTDITMDLRFCQVDNNGISQINSFFEGVSFLNPSQIQKLSIDFTQDFDAPALLNLAHTIFKFASLVSLSQNFSSCNLLTAGSINQSLSQLQALSNLSSLSLKFSSMEMLLSVVGSIAPALKALRSLEDLNLDFSNLPNIQDEEMIMLFESLADLTSLKYLDLNLSELELTCKDLENLALSLKRLDSLRSLGLNFGCTNLIGNKIAETLAGTLSSLKNLAFFSLEFDENDTIDNDGLDQLGEAIRRLSILVKIHLSFFLCPQLNKSDQMLKDLLRALRNSKSLQELSLVLPRSQFIEDEAQQISKRKIVKVTYFNNY